MDTIVAIIKISNREAELLKELVSSIDPNTYDGILYKLHNQPIYYGTDDYDNESKHFYLI